MKLEEVKTIGVVGGGVMGGGIAQVCAIAGYDVVVRDINSDAIEKTREAAIEGKWGIKRAVERGKLNFDTALLAIQRISLTVNLGDLADVEFEIEAIPEQ